MSETSLNTKLASRSEKFEKLFRVVLGPELHKLEVERKKILRPLFPAILIWFVSAQVGADPIGWIATGIGIFFAYKRFSAYRSSFKSRVVKILIESLFPGFTYQSKSGVPRETFFASGLFDKPIDRYRHEDCVQGTVGTVPFIFSEVTSEYKIVKRTGKGTETRYEMAFSGLFFVAEFNKHITGQTFVAAEGMAGPSFGGLLPALWGMGGHYGELIKLENLEFEKFFAVHGNNATEARYILTPTIMESLMRLKAKLLFHMLSFSGNHVYLAIPAFKDHFEPRLFSNGINRADLLSFVTIVEEIMSVVEELNLNTRIWSKV